MRASAMRLFGPAWSPAPRPALELAPQPPSAAVTPEPPSADPGHAGKGRSQRAARAPPSADAATPTRPTWTDEHQLQLMQATLASSTLASPNPHAPPPATAAHPEPPSLLDGLELPLLGGRHRHERADPGPSPSLFGAGGVKQALLEQLRQPKPPPRTPPAPAPQPDEWLHEFRTASASTPPPPSNPPYASAGSWTSPRPAGSAAPAGDARAAASPRSVGGGAAAGGASRAQRLQRLRSGDAGSAFRSLDPLLSTAGEARRGAAPPPPQQQRTSADGVPPDTADVVWPRPPPPAAAPRPGSRAEHAPALAAQWPGAAALPASNGGAWHLAVPQAALLPPGLAAGAHWPGVGAAAAQQQQHAWVAGAVGAEGGASALPSSLQGLQYVVLVPAEALQAALGGAAPAGLPAGVAYAAVPWPAGGLAGWPQAPPK